MSKIIILSGEKQSGKTTNLMRRFAKSNEVGGVLMPVIDGIRHFYDLASKETWKAETDQNKENSFSVGRFTFSVEAFKKANQAIISAIGKFPIVIIDEIGPLEIKQKLGLHPAFEFCLKNRKDIRFLILVVRPSLVEEVRGLAN